MMLFLIPVPETTSAEAFVRCELRRLDENLAAADVELTPDDLLEIESVTSTIKVEGARYPQKLEQLTGR